MFSLVTFIADRVDTYTPIHQPGQTICCSSNTWWRSVIMWSVALFCYIVLLFSKGITFLFYAKCAVGALRML